MKVVHGDIIELAKCGDFDVIVHGCNCFHTMGAGVAKLIAREFPEALEEDRQTKRGDFGKLGTISFADVCIPDGPALTIVNAYTQFRYGGSGRMVDYGAVTSCFREIRVRFEHLRIAYPKIGCGLAGGDWKIVSELINERLEGCDHTLVIYDA